MNKKFVKALQSLSAEHYANLPPAHRLARGDLAFHKGILQAEDPLRIDKLLKAGVIDEMQHLYGLQIITLWTITHRPMLRSTRYDPSMVRGTRPDMHRMALGKMSAEDEFYKTMSLLRPRPHGLISKICFEEKGAIEAGKELKLPINAITVYVRDAFDALGEALSAMRNYRKELEDRAREKTEIA